MVLLAVMSTEAVAVAMPLSPVAPRSRRERVSAPSFRLSAVISTSTVCAVCQLPGVKVSGEVSPVL